MKSRIDNIFQGIKISRLVTFVVLFLYLTLFRSPMYVWVSDLLYSGNKALAAIAVLIIIIDPMLAILCLDILFRVCEKLEAINNRDNGSNIKQAPQHEENRGYEKVKRFFNQA